MNENQFDMIARKTFGALLSGKGFSCEKSRYCCFYRETRGGVFHFVLPDIARGGAWYDVRVFASSPEIDPDFEASFPDDLGIPSGLFSFLNPKSGVGPDQKQFHCRTEEGFLRGFADVGDALIEKAVPYLDKIQSLSDLIPYIVADVYRGIALHRAGQTEIARPLLEREFERLSSIQDPTPKVERWLCAIQSLLGR